MLINCYIYNIIELDSIFCISYQIEQKGMPFDHEFGYSLPLFSSSWKKREEEKENEEQKSWSKVMPSCSILISRVDINVHNFILKGFYQITMDSWK